jgi:hypothetical protein
MVNLKKVITKQNAIFLKQNAFKFSLLLYKVIFYFFTILCLPF